MLTYKIALPDSPNPIIISKKFCLMNKKSKTFFFIFDCWLLPQKISIYPKSNGFAQLEGCSPNPRLVCIWSNWLVCSA